MQDLGAIVETWEEREARLLNSSSSMSTPRSVSRSIASSPINSPRIIASPMSSRPPLVPASARSTESPTPRRNNDTLIPMAIPRKRSLSPSKSSTRLRVHHSAETSRIGSPSVPSTTYNTPRVTSSRSDEGGVVYSDDEYDYSDDENAPPPPPPPADDVRLLHPFFPPLTHSTFIITGTTAPTTSLFETVSFTSTSYDSKARSDANSGSYHQGSSRCDCRIRKVNAALCPIGGGCG